MARTPLARRVWRRRSHGFPQKSPARRVTRGRLLRDAGSRRRAAVSAWSLVPAPLRGDGAARPRVVVVGGGLAGLTCAYRLKQAG